MCKIAELYGKLGEYDNAISTYQEAEATLGKGSNFVAKVYAEHLNYVYETFETTSRDPEKWSKVNKDTIISLYEEGLGAKDIEENTTWIKRSAVMNKLKESMDAPPKQEEKPKTTETEDTSPEGNNEQEGE